MKWMQIFRANDWWDYKIPPILAISYGSFYIANESAANYTVILFWQMISLICGAIFVSVLNDYTDIEDDRKSNKTNRLANKTPLTRNIILLSSTLLCAFVAFHYYPDWKTIAFFTASSLSFVLYSAQPFRWKNNKILGLIADSSGSQMFPSLMMISSVAFSIATHFNIAWVASVFLWSFCFGLRGILWHQFTDRANDLISGSKSFATHTNLQKVKPKIILLFSIETAALCSLFIQMQSAAVLIAFALYWILLLMRIKLFKSTLVLVLTPNHKKYHIVFNEFYQVFLPISILISIALIHPKNWIILALHLFIFSKIIRTIFRDLYRIIEMIVSKTYVHKD